LLSIELTGEQALLERIQEIKATRNLLLHNNLVFNEFYADQAGPRRRWDRDRHDRLLVDHEYVAISVATIVELLEKCADRLLEKYASYTKIRANRTLWAYLFDSPIMSYDEFWDVDETRDAIVAMKTNSHESALASSEKVMLGLWRAHFNGSGEYLARLNMRSLDRRHRARFHFVLSIAPTFPWY
jgi:hypothetical protein